MLGFKELENASKGKVPLGGFILILSDECISWLVPEDRYT
jgi:hypothetical protein